jgi:VWFA-related protein
VVIFVDTMHLSTASFMRLKGTLLKFINEQLTDRDLAAVVTTSGSLGVFSQFTRNREVLRQALERLSFSADLSRGSLYTPFLASSVIRGIPFAVEVAMSIVRAEEHLPSDPLFEPTVRNIATSKARQILNEATYGRRVALLTLKAVAERLAEMPGQRLMLTLSDGFTMFDNSGDIDNSDVQAAVSRAVRSGVVIYSFLAKGLSTLSFFDASRSSVDADGPIAGNLISFTSAGDRELENGLTQLAKDTGGEAFLTTNDISGALAKTLSDNSYYYALAYYPAADDRKNNFRRIKVSVKNHPEYRVRTQNGYLTRDLKRAALAETTDPHKRLLEAINAPLITTDIEIDAAAEVTGLLAQGGQVALILYTDGKNLKYAEVEKSFVSKLELMIEVLNSAGRSDGITQDLIEIKLTPEGYKQSARNVYRYNRNLQLKPGLYQIRIGVRDEHSELIGTTSTWVEVPDPRSKKLFLGGVSLAKSSTAKAAQGGEANANISKPDVRRGVSMYRNTDDIIFVSRAYNVAKQPAELKARVQILQGEKVVFEDEWHPISSITLSKDGDMVVFGAQLNLQPFKPGLYELRLTVGDEKTKNPLVAGKLFEVEP